MKLIHKDKYKGGDGIAVLIIDKAPQRATEQADVIKLVMAQGSKGTSQYFTPDEAMSVAIGLLKAVDVLMIKKYKEFRYEKRN